MRTPAGSRWWPSSVTGRPARTPTTRPMRVMLAASRSRGLHSDERGRFHQEAGAHLAPDRGPDGEDVVAEEADASNEDVASEEGLDAEGDGSRLRARDPRRVRPGGLHRDLGTRVAHADNEDRPSASCPAFLYSCEWAVSR